MCNEVMRACRREACEAGQGGSQGEGVCVKALVSHRDDGNILRVGLEAFTTVAVLAVLQESFKETGDHAWSTLQAMCGSEGP